MSDRTRLDALLARAMKLNYSTPELVFHRVEIDEHCAVLVIGGDGEGAYEWAIVKDGAIERHSDAGYGIPEIALRDGLIAVWGCPELERAQHQLAKVDATLDELGAPHTGTLEGVAVRLSRRGRIRRLSESKPPLPSIEPGKRLSSQSYGAQDLKAWIDLLEMFPDSHALLTGAAGEDMMNVGDALRFLYDLMWRMEETTIPVAVLREHWLHQVECDHEKKQDRPICACSRIDLGWHHSVGAAVEAWINHVMVAACTPAPAESVTPHERPKTVYYAPSVNPVGEPCMVEWPWRTAPRFVREEDYQALADDLSKAIANHGADLSASTIEPNGFAVLLDDKTSSPAGFWFVGCYTQRKMAEQVQRKAAASGRIVPVFFNAAPQPSTADVPPAPSREGVGQGDAAAAALKTLTLDKPAQVGNTVFGKGIDWRVVIERAQREHDYRQRPDHEAVRISQATRLIRGFNVECALAELVELKGMKDALDDHHAGVKQLDDAAEIEANYKVRKPRAWQRAREVLAPGAGLEPRTPKNDA